MARRMYSIDQINSEKPSDINIVAGTGINIDSSATSKTISLALYQHNIDMFSFDNSMHAYKTIYSTYSEPVTNKQELINYLLKSDADMSATGTAESHTKLIYSIQSDGSLHYTDMQGNEGAYIDDYEIYDGVVAIGG